MRALTANRSPARTPATCSGARCSPPSSAPSPVLTSVTAAYLPRNLRPEVATITVHPAWMVFQRPFSGSEIEIAGFEENTSDGRTPAQASDGPGGTLSAAAAARPAHLPEGPADDRVEGGRRQRRSAAVRRLVSPRRRDGVEGAEARDLGRRSSSGTRRRFLMGPTSSASPRPTRRRMPRRRRWPARWRAPASISTTPSRASKSSPPREPVRARPMTFTVRDDQSPVQRVEYSLDASRWRMVYPKDGIPDSRREDFEVVVDDSERAAASSSVPPMR